jgi:hypothetical protein
MGSIVTEVTPENEVVFQLEYDNGGNLYRAQKFDWFFSQFVAGCIDEEACNYNSDANEDDGSCVYLDGVCETCEDGLIVGNDEDNDGICNEDEIDSVLDLANPKRSLIKVTNLLGQEVEITLNTPLLFIYNDGSVEKRLLGEHP